MESSGFAAWVVPASATCGGGTIATIRVGSRNDLPAFGWFGSEIDTEFGTGARLVEAALLAVDPSADDGSLEAHDQLLRTALAIAAAIEAEAVILAVPRRHAVFYRRQWRMQRISMPRQAYGLQIEICLMAVRIGSYKSDRLIVQTPWLRPADGEFDALKAVRSRHGDNSHAPPMPLERTSGTL